MIIGRHILFWAFAVLAQSNIAVAQVPPSWRNWTPSTNHTCSLIAPDSAFVAEMLVPRTDTPHGENTQSTQLKVAQRVAFVAGISEYQAVSPLENPVNDAQSMARALSAIGFRVHYGANLNFKEMKRCLKSFYSDATGSDVALVFFAGHGFALDDKNYLLPVDAAIDPDSKTGANLLAVDQIVLEIRQRATNSLVFLDACRSSLEQGFNLTSSLRRPRRGKRRKDLGGFFFAYAAAPGSTASDGNVEAAHSPFTQALLNNIAQPGQSLQRLMTQVTRYMARSSAGQIPFSDGSIMQSFYFNGELSAQTVQRHSQRFANISADYRKVAERSHAIASALKGMPKNIETDKIAHEFKAAKIEFIKALESPEFYINDGDPSFFSAKFNARGNKLITTSTERRAAIWDAKNGKFLYELDVQLPYGGRVNFSHDGRKIIAPEDYSGFAIFDVQTGERLKTVSAPELRPEKVTLSPDGKSAVVVPDDFGNYTVQIWDIESATQILTLNGHTKGVNSASFSPDGELILTAADDGSARIWNATTGEELHDVVSGPFQFVTSHRIHDAVFSPNGELFATATSANWAHVWRTNDGSHKYSFREHLSSVVSVEFDPDSENVLTSSRDGTAMIWNAETGIVKHTLFGHSDNLRSASFSKDGKFVATVANDDTARIWQLKTPPPSSDASYLARVTKIAIAKAFDELPENLKLEIEAERLRYWEIDQSALQ